MESDIFVEGFRLSERTHGVRYMKLVGDGDSSVTSTIREAVPYGVYVEKIECTNHAVKCYRSRLEQLVKDNPQYRGKGGLTIQRLTFGARVAIRLHSKDRNVTQLCHDLRNGPAHVFGDHTACSKSFCKYAEQAQEEDIEEEDTTLLTSMESSSSTEQLLPATISDHLSRIIEEKTDDEPTFEEEVDAQSGYSQSLSNLPDGLFRKVMACRYRLVVLAPQLIQNLTSNLAECYMGLRTICDGGKQYNRIQKGTFEHRCYAAGLRAQNGPQWGIKVLEAVTGDPVNEVRNLL